MHVLSIVIFVLWLASEILLNVLLRPGKADKQQQDKNSLNVIWLVIIASIIAASQLGYRTYAPIASSFFPVHYTGLALIVLGVILRFAAIRALGKFFTVTVTIREDHQLKTDGFYAYLRHPSYAASLLSFIGYGVSYNNWYSVAAVVIPVFIAFSYRISIEEKVLLTQFGDTYRAYMQRTKRLIPFIY
ncbi:protein-S-isoprenylcysteine O-methyltransferase Ste14 [Chitinophaga dinghuensis]|uniref:Protein-S-isoprenylcysteine O-methyltransferase Ste14 n=1 Tax=Chitinophaga dinghuensis TaxID=1539050 RepID=A0A327VXC3_9BACT|nr:isoprenylcysteine carboxylmethyltransferase family protein [Chitinophaga dinghuensis]RAJ79983.1 protein-S-isoprenylcysteine O-methyltransferase Ste14 [Chitinophaga dinghuensis]